MHVVLVAFSNEQFFIWKLLWIFPCQCNLHAQHTSTPYTQRHTEIDEAATIFTSKYFYLAGELM